MTKKLFTVLFTLTLTMILAACGANNNTDNGTNTQMNGEGGDSTAANNNEDPGETTQNNKEESLEDEIAENEDNLHTNHSTSGVVPEGLKEAENPKYPVGTPIVITAGHMQGMEGAHGTVVGAYETTVYSVSYQPTEGEEFQENHKWVIQEEIDPLGEEALTQGTEVIIQANHENGMMGATGTIDTVEKTIVYMVNYTSTTGEEVKNHKWLKESELTGK